MKNIKRLISSVLVVIMLMTIFITAIPIVSNAATELTLQQLRQKFPHGKYWNHAGNPGASNTVNNQNGYTSTPCSQHGVVGTSKQTCNGFQPGNTQLSWQCMGFAEKLGYDATGYNPRNNANGWYTYTSSSALNNLKPGDIVRYKNDQHSIYIIGVNGDTVTYADCNSDGKCIIRWDVTISKSTLKSTFSYVRSAPVILNTNNYLNIGDDFYAYIIQYDQWKHLEASNGNVQIVSDGNDSYNPKQIWHFIRTSGDNQYKIINEYNGQCLDASNFGTENGTNVGVCDSNDSTAQRWYIGKGPTGAFTISPSYATNLSLDCTNGYTNPGTNIQLYQSNGSNAQEFNIYNIQGDGWSYSKPSAPDASYVTSVSYDSMSQTAIINWSTSALKGSLDNRVYDIRIWKGTDTSVAPCYGKMSVGGTQHSVELDIGTYTINIATVNTKYYQCYTMGSNYSCTLKTSHATNSVSLWACGFKNNEGNNSSLTSRLLGSKTFNKYYGDNFTLTENDCPALIPNGFYLKNAVGSYYNGSVWNTYSFGTTFTQPNKALSFEYDCLPIEYTITYNLNGGINSTNNPTTYNVLYGVTLSTPTREGYTFTGWTDASGKTVTGINPGANANHSSAEELYKILSTRTTGNQVLTANWTHVCANGHTWSNWTATKAPTCTENGEEKRSCSVCGNTETRVITANGEHTWANWAQTKAPTCTENGEEKRNCSVCGNTETRVITANGEHTWGNWTQTKVPTCTENGEEMRSCSVCGTTETRVITAKGEHTWSNWTETKAPTCTENGEEKRSCSVCGTTETRVITAKDEHTWTDWTETKAPTNNETGEEIRTCNICGETETREIPVLTAVPDISIDNYIVTITNAENIKDLRYAPGEYTTTAEIKAAEGNVAISESLVKKYTVDGKFVYEMPNGGYYTVWIRMQDGTNYILPLDVTNFTPTVSAYGVKVTLHDLYDVKDFYIAKGEYQTYREIKDNGYIVSITGAKIGNKHDYTYTVYEPGVHTILVRYNDGTQALFHEELTVDEPVFTTNGLQVTVSNLPDVKVIRTAYGEWNTVKELKATDTIRNFSAKTAIKGKDPYTIQYREEGMVTVIVEYNNGYQKVFHYDVTQKTPTVEQNGNTVTFSDLDGLVTLRYALGEYTTSSQIKNAKGSKALKPADIVDGKITVALTKGTYTFCVQYDDESYNYYTIMVE